MLAIVDYGVGNLGSIRNMFKRIGVDALVTRDPEEIRAATKDERSIDDVTRGLMKLRRRVTTEDFREIAERIAGGPLDSLKSPLLKDPK